MKKLTLPPRTKRIILTEWKQKNTVQDAKKSLFTKKRNKALPYFFKNMNKIETLHNNCGYCNTYIVGELGKNCIVIDPGYNKDNCINKHIDKLYSGVQAILLTHGHFDHISGIKTIYEQYHCQVIMHEDEISKLSNYKENVSSRLNRVIIENIPVYGVSDEDEINIIGLTIKVIHTPFHTNGSVCYYIESLNALFSGDTLFHLAIGRVDLPTGSSKTVESSLEKLRHLPLKTIVYPGHESQTSIENELKYNNYFKK